MGFLDRLLNLSRNQKLTIGVTGLIIGAIGPTVADHFCADMPSLQEMLLQDAQRDPKAVEYARLYFEEKERQEKEEADAEKRDLNAADEIEENT